MNQRERYLAISVGVVVALLLANMGFKKIKTDLTLKENRVEKAQSDLDTLDNVIEGGKRAAKKIERIEKKSLPSDPELAVDQYRAWLIELANQVGLSQESVNFERTQKVQLPGGNQRTPVLAYTFHQFTLAGRCKNEKVVELLAKYYDRDYIHRISKLTLTRDPKQPNVVVVSLTSEAVSMPKADPKQEPSLQPSGRLAMTTEDYKNKILSRNPFAPPNSPPKFETGRSHDIAIGKPWSLELKAADPDGDRVSYELVTDADKLPPGLSLRRGEITWQPTEKGEKEILVRAVDEGWPHKSSELKMALKAVDPPVEKKETPPSTLDPAKQAFLTALVSGRTGTQGMIRSKAEGISIDIFEGSEITIGSIKATVVKVNLRESHIILETDGSRWVADMDTSLADAYAKSRID